MTVCLWGKLLFLQTTEHCKSDVKGSCAAKLECKNEILSNKGNIAKMFLLLFAPVYKLFISLC